MKKLYLLAAFILSLPFTQSGHAQNTDIYPLSVHVSRTDVSAPGPWSDVIEATIERQKLKLARMSSKGPRRRVSLPSVLKCGDYKARILKEEIVSPAEYVREYEILLPGGVTVTYLVIGESENYIPSGLSR
jgi:hypothetical protein